MTAALDTALSTAAMRACCTRTMRAALRAIDTVDDGDTITCAACPTVLELHGRVWLNQAFAPDRSSLA